MTAAIVGRAWRTPLGDDIDVVMGRLDGGASAVGPNRRFDARTYAVSEAATIDVPPARSRHARVLRPMGLFGLEVGLEVGRAAMLQAGLTTSDRVGVFFGVGGLRAHWYELMPALTDQRDDLTDSWARGFRRFHPFWMLQHLSNNAHALVATELGARGEGVTFGGANASAQAIGAADRALQADAIDAAIVVGYDGLVEPETIVEMAAHGALDDAAPGEAAAAIVLERPDRDAPFGYVAAIDASDGSSDLPSLEFATLIAKRLGDGRFTDSLHPQLGLLGAATSIVQTIALSARVADAGEPLIAVSRGAPGLVGAVRVSG